MPETVHDVTLGGTTLKQCESADYRSNAEVARHRASGGTNASLIAGAFAAPMCTFRSGDLQGVITAMLASSNALAVAAGSIVIPFKKRAVGGTYASGTSHFTLTGTDGMAVCTEISATQNQRQGASANIDFHFLSPDGATAPVAENVSQSITTESFNRAYVLGEVGINGSQLDYVVSARVVPGHNVVKGDWAPDIYARECWIEEVDPTIEITFEDFDALATYSALFATLTSASVHFRRRADGGSLVAGATAEHARLSIAAGVWINQGLTAQAQSRGQATVVLHGKTLTASGAAAVSL